MCDTNSGNLCRGTIGGVEDNSFKVDPIAYIFVPVEGELERNLWIGINRYQNGFLLPGKN
jgi:hypothetical protein